MRPFEKPILGEIELALINQATWQLMFNTMGVEDNSRISKAEINAYVELLKRKDSGKAYLKIMRNFDHSPDFRSLCYKAVQNVPYPVQAIWGINDPGLTFDRYGKEIMEAAGLSEVYPLAASHLLQEEQWEAIADKIEEIIQSSIKIRPR